MSKITGYRKLSLEEVEAINRVKNLEAEVLETVGTVRFLYADSDINHRWAAIAETQIEQGFMALTRVIAKPRGE